MFYDSLLQVFWNFPGPLHPMLERQDDHSFLKLKFQVFQDIPGGFCLFFHDKILIWEKQSIYNMQDTKEFKQQNIVFKNKRNKKIY